MIVTRLRQFAISLVVLKLLLLPVALAEPVSLESNPSGIYLSLQGPVSVSGVGPLPIAHLPLGEYRLNADHPGYPAARGRLIRTEIDLISQPWAGLTALFMPPGYIHLERGETRGLFTLCAGVAATAMTIVSHNRVSDAEDKYDRAADVYIRATSENDITVARSNRYLTHMEKNDAENIRSLWITYFAFNWLATGLESMWLTPQPEVTKGLGGLYQVSLPHASGARAALLSSLVPGAGQRFMGNSNKANFFFTATAALVAGAIFAQESYLEASRVQAAAQRDFTNAEAIAEMNLTRQRLQKAVDETDDKNSIRWAFAGAAAFCYTWNIFDAFGLGHQSNVPELTMSAAPEFDGVYLSASWSIR